MFWGRLTSVVLSAALVAAPSLRASASSASVKPEDGYLAPGRYLSRYFGLSLLFPGELKLMPAPIPQVQGSTRWLLGLQTTAGNASSLLITAAPRTNRDKDVVASLRADFTDLPDKHKPVTIGGQSFWKVVTPRQPDPQQPQIVEYAGGVRDYLLKIRLATNSGAVPEALTAAIEHASFLAPDAVNAARTSDMIDYAGPALPELGKPTEAIARLDPGIIDGRRYRNNSLGIDFVVPEGLQVHNLGALQAETTSGEIWGTDGAASVEHHVGETCTRPLLVADAGTRPSSGHISPTVMLVAVDRLCVGGVRFPASVSDTASVKLVAGLMAQRVRAAHSGSEMKGRVYSLEGHIMLNLTGVLYGTESGTGLRVPNRIRMIATEIGQYWLIWTFVAPDTVALDRLSSTSVQFYPAR